MRTPSTFVPPTSRPIVSATRESGRVDIDVLHARFVVDVAHASALVFHELVGRVDQLAHRAQEFVRGAPEMFHGVAARRHFELRIHWNSTTRRSSTNRAPLTVRRTKLSGNRTARRCGPIVTISSFSVRPSCTSSRATN